MTVLSDLQSAVQAVAERASTSIVGIDAGWRGGSAVVVADGIVLTNAHNIHGERVPLVFAGGRTAEGTVAGVDLDGDLSVLTVDTTGAQPLEWAPDDAAALGAPVFAVAATAQGARVTFGLVSSVARAFRGPRGHRISGSIEHTAPMAPGSSGSALLDASGRLVGLNTHRSGAGFYLAIAADAALRAKVEALGRGESAERPRLGVAIAPPWAARRMRRAVGLPERDGLLVREVEDESPAAAAGLAPGDLIVSAGGSPVLGVDDLHDALGRLGGATTLELGVVRGAEERTVTVTFAAA